MIADGNEIVGQINELSDWMNDPQRSRRSVLDRAAVAMLEGNEIEVEALERRRGEMDDCRARLRTAGRAAEIGKQRYGAEVARASREICARLEPRQRARVARLARALIALGEEVESEQEFRDELIAGGVIFAGTLRAMPVYGVGSPRDRQSRIAAWLQEAVEYGFIDESLIPARWREQWST